MDCHFRGDMGQSSHPPRGVSMGPSPLVRMGGAWGAGVDRMGFSFWFALGWLRPRAWQAEGFMEGPLGFFEPARERRREEWEQPVQSGSGFQSPGGGWGPLLGLARKGFLSGSSSQETSLPLPRGG